MHFSRLFTATLFGLSQAIISGFTVPSTIKAGDGFKFQINTANYIQGVQDVAGAAGIIPGAGSQGALGELLGSFYLGPKDSNIVTPIDKRLKMPSDVPSGNAVLSAAFFSLYGEAMSQTMTTYNVTVIIGEKTSTNTVTSSPQSYLPCSV
jgi:Nis1 family